MSTIPYDPSLVLGMIIEPKRIKDLELIANAQKQTDNARNRVNELLRQKLSMDMIKRELITLGAGPDQLKDLEDSIEEILKEVVNTSGDLAKAGINTAREVSKIKNDQDQKQISSSLDSPIDLKQSSLDSQPLAADSMNMDVQYFRSEESKDSSNDHAEAVSAFVSTRISEFLGPTVGAQMGTASNRSVDSTSKSHKILGTVVVCANCTLKSVRMFSPLVLDVDNAIDSYATYMGEEFPIQDRKLMRKIALQPTEPGSTENAMPVLAGASFGASFVGFVHFTKTEKTSSFQAARSLAEQAEADVQEGLFLASVTGSLGLSSQDTDSLKKLLSNSEIQSHCSVITMGVIPTIKSNKVITAVKELKGGPKEHMAQLAAMQGASNSSLVSMGKQANDAKRSASLEQMSTDYITASVDALSDVDKSENQVIDMNSMMTAIDSFVEEVRKGGDIGVPINYYIKYITKTTIAREWMKKYHNELLHPKDDKENGAE